jgi:peptidoglycan/LPS O-acetylase OafA/YrhL
MKYRPEIDGLRALAVMPVIFFHAGIQAFSGGYIGVDVFFVISGYLITSIILSELSNHSFSFIGFYERRARRILPALFFMMAVCLPFAWFWLLPHELKGFSQSLVAVTTYTSNIYFWITTGYFEIAAEFRPLLHTWSLAVEEQYYLLFPILLAVGMRWSRKGIIAILILLALFSLFLAQYLSEIKPSFAFYLLPTRIWELLVGTFLAFYFESHQEVKKKGFIGELGGIFGICLLLYAIFTFDKQTPFPGFYALIPVFGTALVIIYARQATFVGKILSSKLLVCFGLISYSLYLWHQPIFAFARTLSLETSNSFHPIFRIALVFPLGYLSWKFVERPFRDKNQFTRKKIFLYSVLASGFFIVIGLAGQFTNGFLTKDQAAVLAYNEYNNEKEDIGRVGNCFLGQEEGPEKFTSVCSAVNPDDSALIWGDSHAAAFAFGLRSVYPNLSQFTASGCPPILGEAIKTRPLCKKTNDYIGEQVKKLQPSRIFLYSNWDAYGDQKPSIELIKTVEYIRSVSPSSKITLVGGTPQFKPSLPTYMFLNDKKLDLNEVLPSYLYDALSAIDIQFKSFADNNRIDFFSPMDVLCKENVCKITASYEGKVMPIIWDYGHLTAAGSVLLARQIKQ